MKNLYLLTGILSASISAAVAQTPTTSSVPSSFPSSFPTTSTDHGGSGGGVGFRTSSFTALHPNAPGNRPDSRADANNNIGIFQAVDILADAPTSAGVRSTGKRMAPPAPGPVFSLYSEYNYIDSDDSRALAGDTKTHSVTIGGTALFHGDTLLGLNYSYSNSAAVRNALGTSSQSDANFVSLVAAHSFWRFLSIGVAGGYGHTDLDINATNGGGKLRGYTDTWSVSPFLSAAYKCGPLVSSLTVMYQYEDDQTRAGGQKINDDTGKFNVALRETYSITERLKLQATAKYTQAVVGLNNTPGLPEGRHWATFGGRLSYNVSKALEVYAGYTYDAFNVFLKDHTATGGVRYTF